MNREVQQPIVQALRGLCARYPGARAFFEWAANRQNDASETSIDVFERKSSMDRASCIELAKDLSRIGCGNYIVGRRGSKTRVNWIYGLKSIARAAIGQQEDLEAVDPKLAAELDESPQSLPRPSALHSQSEEFLSISEAKRRLAESLGVPVEAIDITIRA